jgi:tetratricopeptide (TPR) repeat protein
MGISFLSTLISACLPRHPSFPVHSSSVLYYRYYPYTHYNRRGNYYSVRGDHVNAIHYFRRSVLLDRHYTQAYVLIGHEFMELKNTFAAIQSYRYATRTSRLLLLFSSIFRKGRDGLESVVWACTML